jgi:hypothetical protein
VADASSRCKELLPLLLTKLVCLLALLLLLLLLPATSGDLNKLKRLLRALASLNLRPLGLRNAGPSPVTDASLGLTAGWLLVKLSETTVVLAAFTRQVRLATCKPKQQQQQQQPQ